MEHKQSVCVVMGEEKDECDELLQQIITKPGSSSLTGGLILRLNKFLKKPAVEVELSAVLVQYLEHLRTSRIYLKNGIFTINFAECALLLQSASNLYAKKVDLLWDCIIAYQERNALYEQKSDQNDVEIKKIEERKERFKRKRKKKEIQTAQQQEEPMTRIPDALYKSVMKNSSDIPDDLLARLLDDTTPAEEIYDDYFNNWYTYDNISNKLNRCPLMTKDLNRLKKKMPFKDHMFREDYYLLNEPIKAVNLEGEIETLLEYSELTTCYLFELNANDFVYLRKHMEMPVEPFRPNNAMEYVLQLFICYYKVSVQTLYKEYRRFISYFEYFLESLPPPVKVLPKSLLNTVKKPAALEINKDKQSEEKDNVGKEAGEGDGGKSSDVAKSKANIELENAKTDDEPDKGKTDDEPGKGKTDDEPDKGKTGDEPDKGKTGDEPDKGKTNEEGANDNKNSEGVEKSKPNCDTIDATTSQLNRLDPIRKTTESRSDVDSGYFDGDMMECHGSEMDKHAQHRSTPFTPLLTPVWEPDYLDDSGIHDTSFNESAATGTALNLSQNTVLTGSQDVTMEEDTGPNVCPNVTTEEEVTVKCRKIIKRKNSEDIDTIQKKPKRQRKPALKLRPSYTTTLKKFEQFFYTNYEPAIGEGTIIPVDFSDSEDGNDTTCEDHSAAVDCEFVKPLGPPPHKPKPAEVIPPAGPEAVAPVKELAPLQPDLEAVAPVGELAALQSGPEAVSPVGDQTPPLSEDAAERQRLADLEEEREILEQLRKEEEERMMKYLNWKQFIERRIRIQSEVNFDIHDEGTRIIESIGTIGKTVSYNSLCRGKSAGEVTRAFIATLQLANTYNVEVINTKGGILANDTLELKLLSKERHHENLGEYQAPSEITLKARMKNAKRAAANTRCMPSTSRTYKKIRLG